MVLHVLTLLDPLSVPAVLDIKKLMVYVKISMNVCVMDRRIDLSVELIRNVKTPQDHTDVSANKVLSILDVRVQVSGFYQIKRLSLCIFRY